MRSRPSLLNNAAKDILNSSLSPLFQTPCRQLSFFFFVFYKFYFIIYLFFWLHWVFVAAHGLSLVAVSGGYSSLPCAGFSLRWLLLLRSMGSRHAGFSSCGMQAQQLWLAGCRAQAQQLWRTSLVATRHVGSSRTRAQTCVPCIGRRILNRCATREEPVIFLSSYFFFRRVTILLIRYWFSSETMP